MITNISNAPLADRVFGFMIASSCFSQTVLA
jgi:hypothetical protein